MKSSPSIALALALSATAAMAADGLSAASQRTQNSGADATLHRAVLENSDRRADRLQPYLLRDVDAYCTTRPANQQI